MTLLVDVHGVTGSSPVLSTIKSPEIKRFRGFFLHFAVKKFDHIFEVTF